MARDPVQYKAKLSSPVERVECDSTPIVGWYQDERRCKLVRSGRTITPFVASKTQVAKIKRRRGTINITSKMIERARRFGGGLGRPRRRRRRR